MGHSARPGSARAGSRLPRQAGFTLAEVMVAMTLLLVGILGTVKMIEAGSAAQSASRGREGATNIARELLEDAHQATYTTIGASGWLTPQMQSLNGGSGTVSTPSASSLRTSVTRRGITYTATVSWCSVDDSKDGYGPKSSSVTWCSDSTTLGTEQSPEDMKRVTAQIDYTRYGRTYTTTQTVTFGATGGIVAPTVTALYPSNPALTGPNYTVTDPAQTSQVFRGVAAGAADMKFTVNGIEVTSGVAPSGSGSWDFTWQLAGVVDGTYTIGAIAVDALGNRSAPYTIQVKLARGAPLTAQNVVGGYNYINPPGPGATGSLVVELEWDANPEGSVTGYEVRRGIWWICGGQTSLANSCIDWFAPSSGTTTYTVKTWYRDANNALQWVSANYNVTAPGQAVATTYWPTNSNTVPSTHCYKTVGGSAFRDLMPTAPTGTTASTTGVSNSWFLCTPALPSGSTIAAGTGSIDVWLTNSSSSACTVNYFLSNNASSSSGGPVWSWSPNNGAAVSVPGRTNTMTKYTFNFSVPARTLVSNDQITLQFQRSCSGITWWYNSTAAATKLSLPTLSAGTPLATPNPPTGLSVTANADGTRTLTWTAPTSGVTVDEYRIYRDGTGVSNRIDTQGATSSSVSWIDGDAGGTAHTYRVTAVSVNLAESSFLGPVTG